MDSMKKLHKTSVNSEQYLNKSQQLQLMESGKRSDMDSLVLNNINMVKRVVAKYKNTFPEYADDLYSAGIEGLMEATRPGRFKPEKGAKFSSYAYFWIRKYVLQFISLNIQQETLSESTKDRVVHIDALYSNDEEGNQHEKISNEIGRDFVSEDVHEHDRHKMLKYAVHELEPVVKRVIISRYLLSKPKSLLEVANDLKLPPSQVKQYQTAGMKAIQAKLRSLGVNSLQEI